VTAARAYWRLTKPGITRLVLVTAAAGCWLGGVASGAPQLAILLHTLAGTGLVVSGTNALNQWWERDADARMARTRARPLPAGLIRPAAALKFGLSVAAAGIVWLAVFVNLLTAALAAAALALYILAYTPLKRRSPLALYVGAVPGALPILGGWTASGAPLDGGGGTLFGILFLWQLPHFLALGWMYREDYRAGGFRMLSRGDPAGRVTARHAAVCSLALVVASFAPAWVGLAAPEYLLGAAVLGSAMIGGSLRLLRAPTPARARGLFLTSIAYLPVLLLLLVILPA
jgi:protoheme IX farnesyltransferase